MYTAMAVKGKTVLLIGQLAASVVAAWQQAGCPHHESAAAGTGQTLQEGEVRGQ